MKNRIYMLVLAGFITACSNPAAVDAKSPAPEAPAKLSAPVAFEFNVPKDSKAGDQVTTTIRFVAETDLHELAISAAPYSGLALLSGGELAVITSLRRGDSHEIEVTVRLDDEVGYLAVYAATTDTRGRTQHKNTTIRYGNAGASTQQKIKSPYLNESSSGEKLILMPAE